MASESTGAAGAAGATGAASEAKGTTVWSCAMAAAGASLCPRAALRVAHWSEIVRENPPPPQTLEFCHTPAELRRFVRPPWSGEWALAQCKAMLQTLSSDASVGLFLDVGRLQAHALGPAILASVYAARGLRTVLSAEEVLMLQHALVYHGSIFHRHCWHTARSLLALYGRPVLEAADNFVVPPRALSVRRAAAQLQHEAARKVAETTQQAWRTLCSYMQSLRKEAECADGVGPLTAQLDRGSLAEGEHKAESAWRVTSKAAPSLADACAEWAAQLPHLSDNRGSALVLILAADNLQQNTRAYLDLLATEERERGRSGGEGEEGEEGEKDTDGPGELEPVMLPDAYTSWGTAQDGTRYTDAHMRDGLAVVLLQTEDCGSAPLVALCPVERAWDAAHDATAWAFDSPLLRRILGMQLTAQYTEFACQQLARSGEAAPLTTSRVEERHLRRVPSRSSAGGAAVHLL